MLVDASIPSEVFELAGIISHQFHSTLKLYGYDVEDIECILIEEYIFFQRSPKYQYMRSNHCGYIRRVFRNKLIDLQRKCEVDCFKSIGFAESTEKEYYINNHISMSYTHALDSWCQIDTFPFKNNKEESIFRDIFIGIQYRDIFKKYNVNFRYVNALKRRMQSHFTID